MSFYGHDFKIWKSHVDTRPTMLSDIKEFFKRNIIYHVIGYDSVYVESEVPHYHFRFISGNPKRTIENRKQKFVEQYNLKGLKGFTHTFCKNGVLKTDGDIKEYLGYALKEHSVECEDKPVQLITSIETLGITALQGFAQSSLQTKIHQTEKAIKEKEKDAYKSQKKDEIIEYIRTNLTQNYDYETDGYLVTIYKILIRYQRENQCYLMNSCMTRYAHTFIQEHTQLSDDDILRIRRLL